MTWAEVWSYLKAAQVISEPWECRLLVEMSKAYLSGLIDGENMFSINPLEHGD